jgi:CheY-like chemotaxis protein/HPt (histidine-containing phosphotransfer) domain-containing protein
MGGRIGAESEEGKGSRFWFTAVFEKQKGDGALQGAKSAAAAAMVGLVGSSASRGANSQTRILLAEDNTTNQQVAVAMLTKLGYRVDAVDNGAEAIMALQNTSYDLILMDGMMPEMDGYEATRRIRSGGAGSCNTEIPIVAITADAMSGDREKCLEAGMDDYVAKPVDLAQLEVVLQKCLTAANGATNTFADVKLPERTESVFDQEKFLTRLMGDKVLAAKVVAGFLSDAPRQLLALKSKIEAGEGEGARLLAHSFKGAAATLSAEALGAVSGEVQKALAGGKLNRALELMPQVERQLELLGGALREWGWA